MDRNDFDRWYKAHRAAFPSLDSWLANQAKKQPPILEAEILRMWFGVLRDVPVEAVLASTRAMLAGDIEEPRTFDRHPAVLRRFALGLNPDRRPGPRPRRKVHGEVRFDCWPCHDEGWRTVWHSRTVAQVLAELTDGTPVTHRLRAAVRCTCQRGQSIRGKLEVPTFDPDVHCEWSVQDNELDGLRKFVQEQAESRGGVVAMKYGAEEWQP